MAKKPIKPKNDINYLDTIQQFLESQISQDSQISQESQDSKTFEEPKHLKPIRLKLLDYLRNRNPKDLRRIQLLFEYLRTYVNSDETLEPLQHLRDSKVSELEDYLEELLRLQQRYVILSFAKGNVDQELKEFKDIEVRINLIKDLIFRLK